jgi:CheY-like chemotaxis protein
LHDDLASLDYPITFNPVGVIIVSCPNRISLDVPNHGWYNTYGRIQLLVLTHPRPGKEYVRILIVDDHEMIRKGVCAVLSARKDIEVCGEAADGLEAIEKAKKLQPDLVIMDITMPKMSGFDAAREIRKLLPAVPILFLTMHDSHQMVRVTK